MGSEHSKAPVWSERIELASPFFNQHTGLGQGVKYLPAKAFAAELVMEAFHIAVLPWASRTDIQGFDVFFLQPVLKVSGYEPRTVVTTDVVRGTVDTDHFPEYHTQFVGTYAAIHVKHMNLPGIFIHKGSVYGDFLS